MKGSVHPFEAPATNDAAQTSAQLRGRITARLAFARQAHPDSHERLSCLREAARLEAILEARERNQI